jgi:hypothetical protein
MAVVEQEDTEEAEVGDRRHLTADQVESAEGTEGAESFLGAAPAGAKNTESAKKPLRGSVSQLAQVVL